MDKNQIVRCPNCGSFAKRYFFNSNQTVHMRCPEHQVTQTECANCDYLMVTCSLNGSVVEAYAPGRYPNVDNEPTPSSPHIKYILGAERSLSTKILAPST